MCHICNMARCPVNCPNHKEKGLYTCKICESGISASEQMYRINGAYYHKECLLDFYDKDELLALLGVRAHPASRESIKGILTILGEKNEK